MGCEVSCPVPIGFKGQVIEWNIPDPYGLGIEYSRDVRDLIERQVAVLVDHLDQRGEAARDALIPSGSKRRAAEARRPKSKVETQKSKG